MIFANTGNPLKTSNRKQSYPMTPSSPSSSSNSSSTGLEQLSKTNLYIRGLPPATTDLDLVKLCHQNQMSNPRGNCRSVWRPRYTQDHQLAPHTILVRWVSCHWETLERILLPTLVFRELTCLSILPCRLHLKMAHRSKWILPTTHLLTVSSASNHRLFYRSVSQRAGGKTLLMTSQ
ncbi:RNA-binding motif, single-stranded-interacting protein 1-like isoform X1 [Lates japonicus]|uniref:RNA-binding motif, single-stranded-interacting protein 1-like isoform X1 n=1 Tax=Lates japonicus TaxID=270547 RepID=A0AAD3MLH4_LATJO|nr:RNA-binding motif, single-stranded-interacting protein 1-like isoform X1 [Lates japonicus]